VAQQERRRDPADVWLGVRCSDQPATVVRTAAPECFAANVFCAAKLTGPRMESVAGEPAPIVRCGKSALSSDMRGGDSRGADAVTSSP
jgi:hypothetical protein